MQRQRSLASHQVEFRSSANSIIDATNKPPIPFRFDGDDPLRDDGVRRALFSHLEHVASATRAGDDQHELPRDMHVCHAALITSSGLQNVNYRLTIGILACM